MLGAGGGQRFESLPFLFAVCAPRPSSSAGRPRRLGGGRAVLRDTWSRWRRHGRAAAGGPWAPSSPRFRLRDRYLPTGRPATTGGSAGGLEGRAGPRGGASFSLPPGRRATATAVAESLPVRCITGRGAGAGGGRHSQSRPGRQRGARKPVPRASAFTSRPCSEF